jgi:hypothetical protein
MPAHHIAFYFSIKANEGRCAGRDKASARSRRRAMNEISASSHYEAGWYEIRLKGHLDSRWTAWFDGLSLSNEIDGTTIISGLIADQAALHGLLQKVRDVGLPLVSVTEINQDVPDVLTITPR